MLFGAAFFTIYVIKGQVVVTASNRQHFYNISMTDCGGGIWRVTCRQNYQRQQGRIFIRSLEEIVEVQSKLSVFPNLAHD